MSKVHSAVCYDFLQGEGFCMGTVIVLIVHFYVITFVHLCVDNSTIPINLQIYLFSQLHILLIIAIFFIYSLSFVLAIYTSDFRLSASIRYLCELSPSCIIVVPGIIWSFKAAYTL